MAALVVELLQYHTLASTLVVETNKKLLPGLMWEFWRKNQLILTTWYAAAAEVALIMTSSASVEMIFSLYGTLFTDEQRSCLSDVIETSMMKRYNENQRASDVN
jgi:hypothetical protein